MKHEIEGLERLRTWCREYAERSGDTRLKQGVETGHDMRAACQLSAAIRFFNGATVFMGSQYPTFEPRANPSPHALEMLATVKRLVGIVNEFQLQQPFVWASVEPLVQRCEAYGEKFTAIIARLHMQTMPDAVLVWMAELGHVRPVADLVI